jgi:hypothetical protein
LNNPAGGSEQEFGIAGFSNENNWCSNKYKTNGSPNGREFGFIGAITYKCGFFNTVDLNQE